MFKVLYVQMNSLNQLLTNIQKFLRKKFREYNSVDSSSLW